MLDLHNAPSAAQLTEMMRARDPRVRAQARRWSQRLSQICAGDVDVQTLREAFKRVPVACPDEPDPEQPAPVTRHAPRSPRRARRARTAAAAPADGPEDPPEPPRRAPRIAATPLLVSDATALAVVGLKPRAFREFVRSAGIPFAHAGRRTLVRADRLLEAVDRLSGAEPRPSALTDEDVVTAAVRGAR